MISIINDKWWHKLWNEIIISNHPAHVLHINSAIVITVIASSSLPVGRWSLSNDCTFSVHYSDVITSTVASQITGVSIVCSIVCSDADQTSKLRVTGPLCGESTGDRIPLTKASNAENVSIWWRHHVVFRQRCLLCSCPVCAFYRRIMSCWLVSLR